MPLSEEEVLYSPFVRWYRRHGWYPDPSMYIRWLRVRPPIDDDADTVRVVYIEIDEDALPEEPDGFGD